MIDTEVTKSERFNRKLQEDKRFNKIYLDYLTDPTEAKKERLNELYKQHEKRLMGLAYLRKMVVFEAKRFDFEIRKEKNNCFSLDSEQGVDVSFSDLVEDENAKKSFERVFDNELKEVFCNEEIYRQILVMTDRQKEVLCGLYVFTLTEDALAKQLGVSQQAVSKTHRNIIRKLREVVGCR